MNKWNYDTCYELAKTCKTRSEFKNKSSRAYELAREGNWLKEYTWFLSEKDARSKNRIWTLEKCEEEAKKYNSIREFEHGSPCAYAKSNKYGYMSEFTWLRRNRAPNGAFTYEQCKEIASKCNTRTQFFKESSSAYKTSIKNKWIDDFFPKKGTIYTEEYITECAKKCETKSEFRKRYRYAYDIAKRSGLLGKYDWLRDKRLDIKGKIDCVYAYEFEEYNAVYIGRTLMRNARNRDVQHIVRVDKDAVAKFAKEHGISVPKMKILEKNLTLENGVRREGEWLQIYISRGYRPLNRAKTGSLGGLAKGKWTKEKCKEVSLECSTLKDLRKNFPGAYNAIYNNGWKDLLTHFPKPKRYSEVDCRNVALQYKTVTDFQKGSPREFYAAYRNDWLKQYNWFNKHNPSAPQKWYYGNTYEEAKKYEYLYDFAKHSRGAYKAAKKNGWLLDYTWLKYKQAPKGSYTFDKCMELASLCKNKSEFNHKYWQAWKYSKKNGWLDFFFGDADGIQLTLFGL